MNVPAGGANRITNGVFNAENTQWQTNSVWNGGGMATRPLFTLATPVPTNQLRFFATGGDNSYSVSQVEAFGTVVTARRSRPPSCSSRLASQHWWRADSRSKS